MEKQFSIKIENNQTETEVQESIALHNSQPYGKSIFFTPQEIWNKIRKLPDRKAPGRDGIPNCALKHWEKITNKPNKHLQQLHSSRVLPSVLETLNFNNVT